MFELKDKVAIITGARRGMGRTHALILAKAGARVVVSDISQEDCQKVAKEIEKSGGEALAIKCDVSKKKEIEEMVKHMAEEGMMIRGKSIRDIKILAVQHRVEKCGCAFAAVVLWD